MTDKEFKEWESRVFGYGYGSGEKHVFLALRSFLDVIPTLKTQKLCPHQYDFKKLEVQLNPCIVWLLINTLCDADIIDYGTSPRYGWLTEEGRELKAFVKSKSTEELITILSKED